MRCQKILESLRIFFSRRDSEISSEINNPNSSPTDTNELTPITENGIVYKQPSKKSLISDRVMQNSASQSLDIIEVVSPNILVNVEKYSDTYSNRVLKFNKECYPQKSRRSVVKLYDFTRVVYSSIFLTGYDDSLIIFYNNGNRHCPLEGWFQPCFGCSTITGQLHRCDDYKHYNVHVRLCELCSKSFTLEPNRNIKHLNELDDIIKMIPPIVLKLNIDS